jgi:hypothetical protein
LSVIPQLGIAIREFARRSNLDDKQVRRGIESGRLIPLADGTLKPSDVVTPWRKAVRHRADKSKSVRSEVSAPTKPAATVRSNETPEAAAERIVLEAGARMSIGEAETLKENYLALLRQLEYDVKSAAVVSVADVAKAVGAQFAQVRTKMLAIPAEQAPQVHRLKTVAEVQDFLMSIIVEALEGLTRDGPTAAP